ncbi:ATPase [Bifidobacterium sp. DSM 109957]|uniref:ATPase n=1 Tax=Bifidobacterium oedipodis TaxID=2675322 RepID=A0A7Y0ERQ2_9BIFI|nr:DUF4143 domain-containing protein [Bifidobacterium sp. DSM 109957]NMM95204.1 ATPase [Bifidobacterium sp. DSM 109957]
MSKVVQRYVDAHDVAQVIDLHYFNTNRLGEVDFVVQDGATVIPIEVKSGNDWKRHKALDNMLAVSDWHLNDAYVLCKGNIEQDGAITYVPLYMSMFIKPCPRPASMIHTVDLSAL